MRSIVDQALAEAAPSSLRDRLVELGNDPYRVSSFYGPVADFCWKHASLAEKPLLVGVSGPQGGGKSTLTRCLSQAFSDLGRASLSVSLDDFYLTHSEQLDLAAAHPGDRLLEHRGAPGTHDVALLHRTLLSLRAGKSTLVPAYDKSAHAGRGDRATSQTFRHVIAPLRVIFVEGWTLGFEPLPNSSCPPELAASNGLLRAYQPIHRLLDLFVLLDAERLDHIVDYRIDAERQRRGRGEPSLSDTDARDYIERFLIAYTAYLPALRAHQPGLASMTFTIDEARRASLGLSRV